MTDIAIRESSCLGTQFLAFRSAIHDLWGERGWSDVVERLPESARAGLLKRPIAPIEWVPERHVMALNEAVFAGPVRADLDVHRTFINAYMTRGFGQIRAMFLRFASPEALLARAPELWRHDHTHGVLTVAVGQENARAVLRNHVHVTTALTRHTAAETFRDALSRTRARAVTTSHRLTDDGALEVDFTWK